MRAKFVFFIRIQKKKKSKILKKNYSEKNVRKNIEKNQKSRVNHIATNFLTFSTKNCLLF